MGRVNRAVFDKVKWKVNENRTGISGVLTTEIDANISYLINDSWHD